MLDTNLTKKNYFWIGSADIPILMYTLKLITNS